LYCIALTFASRFLFRSVVLDWIHASIIIVALMTDTTKLL
jgi:hypothetical protein